MGYYGRLPDGTSLESELWGILKGLKVITGQETRNLDIESDPRISLTGLLWRNVENCYQKAAATLVTLRDWNKAGRPSLNFRGS